MLANPFLYHICTEFCVGYKSCYFLSSSQQVYVCPLKFLPILLYIFSAQFLYTHMSTSCSIPFTTFSDPSHPTSSPLYLHTVIITPLFVFSNPTVPQHIFWDILSSDMSHCLYHWLPCWGSKFPIAPLNKYQLSCSYWRVVRSIHITDTGENFAIAFNERWIISSHLDSETVS